MEDILKQVVPPLVKRGRLPRNSESLVVFYVRACPCRHILVISTFLLALMTGHAQRRPSSDR